MFTKLNASFGAETSEIDLSKVQKDTIIELIKNEFLIHSALVFRNQNLDDNALVRFGKIFGELEEHLIENSDGKIMSPVHSITNYDSSGKPSSRPYINTNYFWHSDKSYLKKPSLATLLYPVILPLNGGDTQLAHMGLALEALPDVTKNKIDNLKVIHSIEFMRHSLDNPPPTKKQILNAPPVTHPIIKKHPETNQNCLYIGMYASHIENLPVEEGRLILARLQEQSTQPPFIYNHKWEKGDLLIWDNRCLMHRGISNYQMATEERVLKRVCITT
tara:strand:+ start:460 stop:1284 length:825 start_codon:yes stop_codon:yes gene_type:complete